MKLNKRFVPHILLITVVITFVLYIIQFFSREKSSYFENYFENRKDIYFENRKDLLYYKKTLSILNDLSEHNDSLLDVGGWKGEFISKVNGFTDKTVIDLHKKPKNFPEDINFISSDFIKANINKKYDVVICMQVLEHIDNDIIHRFTQKLFEVGKMVLISVPYKWNKGACKYHIQDPVDENKLKSWTKKEPTRTWIIKEKKSKLSRLIALYS